MSVHRVAQSGRPRSYVQPVYPLTARRPLSAATADVLFVPYTRTSSGWEFARSQDAASTSSCSTHGIAVERCIARTVSSPPAEIIDKKHTTAATCTAYRVDGSPTRRSRRRTLGSATTR